MRKEPQEELILEVSWVRRQRDRVRAGASAQSQQTGADRSVKEGRTRGAGPKRAALRGERWSTGEQDHLDDPYSQLQKVLLVTLSVQLHSPEAEAGNPRATCRNGEPAKHMY